MRKVTNLKTGDMVSFTVKDLGTFKLAVCDCVNRVAEEKTQKFLFVSEDMKSYVYGPYSGGRTGAGINDYDVRKFYDYSAYEDYHFVKFVDES
jgi:NADH:ubiquinone oxidoreductase subunit D